MRHAVLGLIAATAAFTPLADASDGLRVACWNITNYGGGNIANLQNVVYGEFNGNQFAPDVILLQEIENSGALAQIVSGLNSAAGSPGDWTSGQFFSGGGGGINTALVYRAGVLDLVGSTLVAPNGGTSANPRNIVRYDVRLEGYLAEETVMALYPVHMKAGSSSSDQARRLVEAQIIRDDADSLPPGRHIIVGGDFNIQSSFQSAYQELTGFQVNNNGRVFDPINTPGTWNNSFTYRMIHTQDPVGGGGMDDRLDQLLLSSGLGDGIGLDYVGQFQTAWNLSTPTDPNHSYRCWGNDGTSYNQRMTTTGNTMVGPSIANSIISLAGNTGHCPVYLDMVVPAKFGVSNGVIDFGTVNLNDPAVVQLTIANAGDITVWGPGGIQDLEYEFISTGAVSAATGTFFDPAGGGGNPHPFAADTSTVGPITGSVTIISNDPDIPEFTVTVSGEVVGAPCPADLAAPFGVLDLADIGAFTGGFTAQDPIADLADPIGVFDLADISVFVGSFLAGCP
jgi:hypothetical protein